MSIFVFVVVDFVVVGLCLLECVLFIVSFISFRCFVDAPYVFVFEVIGRCLLECVAIRKFISCWC